MRQKTTVRELIADLQDVDPDLIVYYEVSDCAECGTYHNGVKV